MSFSFPSLLFHEGRTYGQPEVVPISLPQVATGLRSRLAKMRRMGIITTDSENQQKSSWILVKDLNK